MPVKGPFFLEDKWLSGRLGVQCYGLSNRGIAFEDLPQTKPVFITAKVKNNEPELNRELVELGFREINKQVTFRKALEGRGYLKEFPLPPEYKIDIQSSLTQFAKFSSLFEFDRFSMDKSLPSNWSSIIKGEWVRGSDLSKRFVVVYSGDEEVGFILFKTGVDCVIELVCVLEEYRGKGLARCMLSFLQDVMQKESAVDMVVGTQKENPNSTYVYRSFGFVLAGEQNVLHFSRGIELHG